MLVSFRMLQARYLQLRERALRDSVSVSAYFRNCVERELDLNVIAECEASVGQSELPQDVQELIGIAEGISVDDRAERDVYHDYLAEK